MVFPFSVYKPKKEDSLTLFFPKRAFPPFLCVKNVYICTKMPLENGGSAMFCEEEEDWEDEEEDDEEEEEW